jgi:inward rectifier potassium channel
MDDDTLPRTVPRTVEDLELEAEVDAETAVEVEAVDRLGGAPAGLGMSGAQGGPAGPPEMPRLFSSARRGIEIRNRRRSARDVYHWLLTTTWPVFAGIGLSAYLGLNTVFACLFLLDPAGIDHARPGAFADAFFFSVQTIGTIGYGVLAPKDLYANLVMTAENFLGLSFVAVSTGVIFARVSRPTARVLFSRNALITRHEGQRTLMIRAANERANQILEAEVSLSITKLQRTTEGQIMRRFEDLKVVRARTPLFALTWSILHVIDEASPLHGLTLETMRAQGLQIIVVLSGIDETFAQRIHARYAYLPEDIVWDKRFADVIIFDEDGKRIIDYGRFHDIEESVLATAPL